MIGAIVINNNFKEESHFSMEKKKDPLSKEGKIYYQKN